MFHVTGYQDGAAVVEARFTSVHKAVRVADWLDFEEHLESIEITYVDEHGVTGGKEAIIAHATTRYYEAYVGIVA